MSRRDLPRPVAYLSQVARDYPQAWATMDQLRGYHGNGHPDFDWPDWCLLPLAGAYAAVSERWTGGWVVPFDRAQDVGILGALYAWRTGLGIYRCDPTVAAALVETPLDHAIPAEVLLALPEYGVYVAAPEPAPAAWPKGVKGFWAHLEQDANDKRRELRLVLDTDHDKRPVPIHLVGTLAQGLAAMAGEARRVAGDLDVDLLATPAEVDESMALLGGGVRPLVSLLLYLCAGESDIEGPGGRRPGRAVPQETRGGPRILQPPAATIWRVGERVGAALRQAAQDGEGRRPHLRTHHWHTYWTGPKAGPQVPAVRWVPAVPVGLAL